MDLPLIIENYGAQYPWIGGYCADFVFEAMVLNDSHEDGINFGRIAYLGIYRKGEMELGNIMAEHDPVFYFNHGEFNRGLNGNNEIVMKTIIQFLETMPKVITDLSTHEALNVEHPGNIDPPYDEENFDGIWMTFR